MVKLFLIIPPGFGFCVSLISYSDIFDAQCTFVNPLFISMFVMRKLLSSDIFIFMSSK